MWEKSTYVLRRIREEWELFDLWFQPGHETITTDLIVAELKRGRHQKALEYIRAGHIQVEQCPPDFIFDAFVLMEKIGEKRLSTAEAERDALREEVEAQRRQGGSSPGRILFFRSPKYITI